MRVRRQAVATDRQFRSSCVVSDQGPAERWQHSGRILEFTEKAGVLAARVLEEHVLDVLAVKGSITGNQSAAGLRLKRDFHAAGMEARVIGSYNPSRTTFSPFGDWNDRTVAEEAAYQRWREAVRALGIQYSNVVLTVACYDQMPEEHQVPALKAGLARLALWYGGVVGRGAGNAT